MKNQNRKILIVDDEVQLLKDWKKFLEEEDFGKITTEFDAESAIELNKKEMFDLALLDIRLEQELDGIDILKEIRKDTPECFCIMVTAYDDLDPATEALKLGAKDYLKKGILERADFVKAVRNGIEWLELEEKNIRLEKQKNNAEMIKREADIKSKSEEERYNDLKIFSKGAAHQFKNSAFRSSMELSLLENTIEYSKNEHFPKEKRERALRHIDSLKREAKRSRNIALRMKAMDDKFPLEWASINTKEFMDDLIQYYCIQISGRVQIIEGKNLTLDIATNVPGIINVDKHYLSEAFIDILDNAYDAAIPGKEDEIRCDISVKMVSDKDGNGVLFSFLDNGRGISDNNLDYIYTPFYTTKGSEGIGLGVPYVKCVVEKHIGDNQKGKIEIDSEFGKWTKVDVYIPLVDKTSEE